MGDFWYNWLYFTRRERKSILLLLTLLAFINIGAEVYSKYRGTQTPFVVPAKLQAEWDLWVRKNTNNTISEGSAESPTRLNPFRFDPNTLDSLGFISMGLAPERVRSLLNWRRKGKVFRSAEDFAQLRGLSPEQFDTLRPYIRLSNNDHFPTYNRTEKPLPSELDLNTVDSATLVRIDGIGPYLAHRIIQYRHSLGSFLSNKQLLEIHHFPDSTLLRLQKQLIVHQSSIRLIHLNTVDEATLARHPYIGPLMARNIILLRSGLSKYYNIDQLKEVPLMNDEKYRKIAPYCTIE